MIKSNSLKHCTTIARWICLLLMAFQVEAAHRILFTFGKVEVLRTNNQGGNQVWTFLTKKELVNDNDLIRIPPRGLLRLKRNDQELLPTLPGGQENKVSNLIQAGLARKKQGRYVNQNLNEQPAIDILPLESKSTEVRSKSQPMSANMYRRISNAELVQFRRQLDTLSDHIVAQFPAPKVDNQTNSYPSTNIYLAQILYPFCTQIPLKSQPASVETVTSADQKLCLLYAQLLHHFKIPTDLALDKSGDLLVLFDSGIITSEAERLSANTSLTRLPDSVTSTLVSRLGNDGTKGDQGETDQLKVSEGNQIWLAIRFSPKWNFTTAWYTASEANGNR